MRNLLYLVLLTGSCAYAQVQNLTVPVVLAPAPAKLAVAEKVRVQPERLESRMSPGFTTGVLVFSLFSEVNTEVKLSSSDPRLVFRVADNKIRLPAYANQSINAVALEAHSGTITVTNTEGKVLATVPYTVAPAKQFSQGASLNYNPFGNTASLNYSISGVSTSPLDPTWSLSVGMGLDLATPSVSSGTINLSVRW